MVEPHRRQVKARIAPVADTVVVALVDIGQHIFAAVRRDARAANDVAVLVADRDDLVAVVADDGFAGTAARQVLVVDLRAPRVMRGRSLLSTMIWLLNWMMTRSPISRSTSVPSGRSRLRRC